MGLGEFGGLGGDVDGVFGDDALAIVDEVSRGLGSVIIDGFEHATSSVIIGEANFVVSIGLVNHLHELVLRIEVIVPLGVLTQVAISIIARSSLGL